MSVPVAKFQQRLAGLRAGLGNTERVRDVAIAQYNAQLGAIQECEHWLVEAQKDAAEEEPAAGLQVVK